MSTGTLIIKANDKWHNVRISFKAQISYVLPILEQWWSTQECIDLILKNCGRGVKMIFVRVPPQDMPEDAAFIDWVERERDNVWHNGEQFDHSPNICVSPINPVMSKMVLEDYRASPLPVTDSYDSLDDAKLATNQPFIFIWDGEKWAGEKNPPKSRKMGMGTPWSRSRK